MSCWTNGSYIPDGMDFDEWADYLNYKVDMFHDFREDPEYKDFLEFMLEDEEVDNVLTLSEEDLSSTKARAENVMNNLEKYLSDKPKEEKLKKLSDIHKESQSRLLFEYIKKNGPLEPELVFLSPSNSFLEDEQKARTFTDIQKILNAKSFNRDDTELMNALNSYETVLKTEPWAEKHSKVIENWINSKAGDKSAVFTKIVDAKVQVLSDTISRQPEPVKHKQKRRDSDWER